MQTMLVLLDYCKLNHITKSDMLPLPRIDDTLKQLARERHFTTLHMSSGYWQVAMDSVSQEMTAFSTYADLCEFKNAIWIGKCTSYLPKFNGGT